MKVNPLTVTKIDQNPFNITNVDDHQALFCKKIGSVYYSGVQPFVPA